VGGSLFPGLPDTNKKVEQGTKEKSPRERKRSKKAAYESEIV